VAKIGRPEVFDTIILEKLRSAFAFGCTDEEAIAYANVPTTTFYDYLKRHPEFAEERDRLKLSPILKARKTVIDDLEKTDSAKWYLERKKKDEFSLRVESTGKDGKDLSVRDDPRLLKTVLELSRGLLDELEDKKSSE